MKPYTSLKISKIDQFLTNLMRLYALVCSPVYQSIFIDNAI